MTSDRDLKLRALACRRRLLEVIRHAGAGHTGGGLSCMDILCVLYQRVLRLDPARWPDPDRDRYVQSKGHCVEALYVVLADRGFFPGSDLERVCAYGSPYSGHPTRHVRGIEHNTGALGHGLPVCVGMAIAAQRDRSSWRVFTLLGDGEMAEGSNWEAALAGSHHRLDNLTAIVDRNRLQITGPTAQVCSTDPLEAKFAAFGWAVRTVDGHDLEALARALSAPAEPGKPTVVIADTVKGRGVSFMENRAEWHHRVPTAEELAKATAELDAAASLLGGGKP